MNTIIEKIRAEVNRLMRENSSSSGLEGGVLNLTYEDGINTALNDVLEILDTLQEQPVELDEKTLLTEMANVYGTYTRPDYIEENTAEAGCDFECAIARHFYELGRQSKEQVCEDVSEDVEEAAEEYASDEMMSGLAERAFIAGAKWQKAQSDKDLSEKIASAYQLGLADKEKMMMKEAVEGCVTMYANKAYPTLIGIRERIGDTGDKVKIIIVKED